MTSAPRDPPPFASVLDALPTGILLIEPPGTVAWANPAYFATTGRSASMIGQDFHTILEEDGTWSRPIGTAVDAALTTGAPASFTGVRARYRDRPGGVYLDVDVRPMGGTDAPPHRVVLLVRDVSDRIDDAQRARLFYEAFRTSTNPMQLTDARGVMVDVNPAFERIYGYAREEAVGRKPNLIRSRHTPSEVYDQMWSQLLAPDRGYWSGEILNRDRAGRERPVILSITAIRAPNGAITHYLGVAVDLSQQRSWELQAAHGDRLASVGQLAAGVAHEINTPLANILLVAESLKRRSTDPWVRSRLETMAGQVEIAAGIVRGLLDFARRDDPHMAEVDLTSVVQGTVEFLRGKQSVDLELVEDLPDAPVPVLGDRGQLIQVVTNLLNNAADAMEGKGTIRLEVRRRGDRGEISVLDTGPGIPPDVLPRIFDPFFTTKGEGQGTGLGLAICHGIVASHHGTLSARNVPGAGAEFLVSLPIAPREPGAPSPAPDG